MRITAPVIAGNWKMNIGPGDTGAFFDVFLPLFDGSAPGSVAIFPPALSVSAARRSIGDRTDILLGVQNVYWEPKGAFTGEISASMAAGAGAVLVLVGHSERRHVFGESDADSARKVRATLDAGLVAVFCVGETLEMRESGRAFEMVERQFAAVSASLKPADLPRLLLAYEPVWAIGTGRTAAPADATEMHLHLRNLLDRDFGAAAADLPILYGGSVNSGNAADLLAAPGVDGLLIGGASLDPHQFAQICALRTRRS